MHQAVNADGALPPALFLDCFLSSFPLSFGARDRSWPRLASLPADYNAPYLKRSRFIPQDLVNEDDVRCHVIGQREVKVSEALGWLQPSGFVSH